jgi:hypothetical protein
MVSDDQDLQSILAHASRVGLLLTEEEAAELVKGVARMQEMSRKVRDLLSDTDEPAVSFSAVRERRS